MGKAKAEGMLFWTDEEYFLLSKAMESKPSSFYMFEILYWTGIREGEMLALTSKDFDFRRKKMSITKTYQRIKGEDLITPPKTENSNRVIDLPDFLCQELQDYLSTIYISDENERIFPVTKEYLLHEMDRGAKTAGVKRIRIHDLRHSHVAWLMNQRFPTVAIGKRLGHDSAAITLKYGHLYPSTQEEMIRKMDEEHEDQEKGEKGMNGTNQRAGQPPAAPPKKKKDEHARKRNVIMNFRVSPKEKELIDKRIALSGLSRSDFFLESCMYQAILVKGNVKTIHKLQGEMKRMASLLAADPKLKEMDHETAESMRMILEILTSYKG